jgi:hypothetical protein
VKTNDLGLRDNNLSYDIKRYVSNDYARRQPFEKERLIKNGGICLISLRKNCKLSAASLRSRIFYENADDKDIGLRYKAITFHFVYCLEGEGFI